MTFLCEAPGCRRIGYHVAGCPGPAHCRGCSPWDVATGYRLCVPHIDHIGSNALLAAELWHDLAESLAGGAGGLSAAVSGTRDRGLKLNTRAVALRTEISHTLTSWVKLVVDEWHLDGPDDDIDSKAKFINAHAQRIAQHDLAGECAGELHALAWGSARTVAYRSGARTRPIGLCPVSGCPGEARAIMRRPDSLSPSEVRCALNVEHVWQPHQWAALNEPDAQPSLTTDEAALMLGVSTDSVYAYVRRGRLKSDGGRPALYAYAEVLALSKELWEMAA
jgi:hypothetical protein